MVVSWRPLTLVEARGFITHYTVTYSPQMLRKRQAAMIRVVPDANTVTIEGLDADTAYSVQVSGATVAGDGVDGNAVISVAAPQGNIYYFNLYN